MILNPNDVCLINGECEENPHALYAGKMIQLKKDNWKVTTQSVG